MAYVVRKSRHLYDFWEILRTHFTVEARKTHEAFRHTAAQLADLQTVSQAIMQELPLAH
ncbi:hypothetical protein QMK28_01160 [Streptomyces sp. H27-D2]|nr:hypothetical protein [Streptomyces sp. H27-D2]MEC4014966.1 hypothetical protein [Streptomyces sp. H27-D2]